MKKTWLGLVLSAAATAAFVVSGTPSAQAHLEEVAAHVAEASQDAASRGTTAAISFLDRLTGQYVDNGALAKQHFGSASVVKVFVADDLYYRAWRGEIRMTDFDWQQADIMLRSSDNDATNRFWSAHGGPAIINRIKARYNLVQTQPPVSARWWGLTRITSWDMSLYYARVVNGEGGMPAWLGERLVEKLQQFTTYGTDGFYQRHGLPDGLPGESPIAVKQGWMCCQENLRTINSAGIAGVEKRFIIVVLAQEPGSTSTYAHTQESVTRAVQKMFPGGRVPRPAERNPFGSLDVVQVDPVTMRFRAAGWAIDPDTAASIGAPLTAGPAYLGGPAAALPRPDLVQYWPWAGPNHGFDRTLPMPGGTVDICVHGQNTGSGDANPQLGCRRVSAPHKPFGSLDAITAGQGVVRAQGWVMETELGGSQTPAHLLVDGRAIDLGWAGLNRPDLAGGYGVWGTAHGFDRTVAVPAGTHEVCVRGVDLATAAGDTVIGCTTVVVP